MAESKPSAMGIKAVQLTGLVMVLGGPFVMCGEGLWGVGMFVFVAGAVALVGASLVGWLFHG